MPREMLAGGEGGMRGKARGGHSRAITGQTKKDSIRERFFVTRGNFPTILDAMKANQFFAPSITFANGATIETNENSVIVTDAEGGAFEYRDGGHFAEVESDFLNYEALIAVLSNENWTEDEISELMGDSRECAERNFRFS